VRHSRMWSVLGTAAFVATVGLPVEAQQKNSPKNGTKPVSVKTSVARKNNTKPASLDSRTWAPAVNPKALSANVRRGLSWLAETQLSNGGWSQGEESAEMGGGRRTEARGGKAGSKAASMRGGKQSNATSDPASVADTCIATLALLRAGNTPKSGSYARNVRDAIAFVCAEIEESDAKSMYITQNRSTRVQSKLGPYIDTFLAAQLLAEVKGEMHDAKAEKRVLAASKKVMDKISRNQREDGTWTGDGWAPVLSQSVASKAINRSAQKGIAVGDKTLARTEDFSRSQFVAKAGVPAKTSVGAGRMSGGGGVGGYAGLAGPPGRASASASGFTSVGGAGGSAGVELYAAAGNLAAMQEAQNTNGILEKQARQTLRDSKKPEERKKAEATLKRISTTRTEFRKAQDAVIARLDDKQFISGFGSNGGEEFLSYMNIGESLVVKGGKEWVSWDKSITENLNRIQNSDGTWTGHHCITGRTFCTAAALLVLTVDRAPVPVAAKFTRR
jgi:hypothetical protein